jgi:hypothetical protein
MEIDAKLRRELTKKFEMQMNRHEIEVTETWRSELETIYRKRYESLGGLQIDLKKMIDRMTNRVKVLASMIKEERQ